MIFSIDKILINKMFANFVSTFYNKIFFLILSLLQVVLEKVEKIKKVVVIKIKI